MVFRVSALMLLGSTSITPAWRCDIGHCVHVAWPMVAAVPGWEIINYPIVMNTRGAVCTNCIYKSMYHYQHHRIILIVVVAEAKH